MVELFCRVEALEAVNAVWLKLEWQPSHECGIPPAILAPIWGIPPCQLIRLGRHSTKVSIGFPPGQQREHRPQFRQLDQPTPNHPVLNTRIKLIPRHTKGLARRVITQ